MNIMQGEHTVTIVIFFQSYRFTSTAC